MKSFTQTSLLTSGLIKHQYCYLEVMAKMKKHSCKKAARSKPDSRNRNCISLGQNLHPFQQNLAKEIFWCTSLERKKNRLRQPFIFISQQPDRRGLPPGEMVRVDAEGHVTADENAPLLTCSFCGRPMYFFSVHGCGT